MIRALVVSMRPPQWLKNVFVLTAPVFAKRIDEPESALLTAAAIAFFSLVASGVYLVNDVADRERDRLHPVKRRRPIAAGELAPGTALAASAFCFAAGIGGPFLLRPARPELAGLLLAYVLIQALYSFRLRHVVILDVFCVASGFVLRVFAGAFAVGVEASSWLILTTIFLSLFLALCKRRAEVAVLAEGGSDHRSTLGEYEVSFLDQLISVTTASLVLCYSLYTLSDRTYQEFHTRNLAATVPFVLFGVFRYLYLVYKRGGGGSPTTEVAKDPPLLVNAFLWAAVTAAVLYL